MGNSSFEVVGDATIEVTRQIPVKDGEPKVEKRRRELDRIGVEFFTRTYKRL